MRRHAIAIAAERPLARHLAWWAALVAGLLVLLAVRDAAGREPRMFAAPTHGTLAEGQLVTRVGGPPAGEESHFEAAIAPPQATLRRSDRPRRAAGRAGVPVRRGAGGESFVLPATAGVPQAPTGGTAPFEAPAAEVLPLRGALAYGVRGPPEVSAPRG